MWSSSARAIWLAALPTDANPVGMEAGREIHQGWLAEKPEEVIQWARTVTNEGFLRAISAAKREAKQR